MSEERCADCRGTGFLPGGIYCHCELARELMRDALRTRWSDAKKKAARDAPWFNEDER
jgi:hypothetical protein